VGQIIGAIVAETRQQAKRAAEQVAITYQDIQPIFFTIEVFLNNFTLIKHLMECYMKVWEQHLSFILLITKSFFLLRRP